MCKKWRGMGDYGGTLPHEYELGVEERGKGEGRGNFGTLVLTFGPRPNNWSRNVFSNQKKVKPFKS